MLPDSLPVLPCRIAGIPVPAVFGMGNMQFFHEVVAPGLGEDRGCGDAQVFAVALYDAMMGNVVVRDEFIAVNKDEFGAVFQHVERAVHAGQRSFKDVDAVDLLTAHLGDGVVDGVAQDVVAESFTPGL